MVGLVSDEFDEQQLASLLACWLLARLRASCWLPRFLGDAESLVAGRGKTGENIETAKLKNNMQYMIQGEKKRKKGYSLK